MCHAECMTGYGFAGLAVGDGALVLGVCQWVRSRRAGSWAPLSSASISTAAAAAFAVAVGVLLLGAVGVPASWVMNSATGFLLGGALLLVLSSGLGWRERRHEALMALGRGEPSKPRMVHPMVFFAAGALGVYGMLLAISGYGNALDALTNAAGAHAPTDLMRGLRLFCSLRCCSVGWPLWCSGDVALELPGSTSSRLQVSRCEWPVSARMLSIASAAWARLTLTPLNGDPLCAPNHESRRKYW